MGKTTVQGDEPTADELDEGFDLDDPDLLRPAPQAWRARTAIEMIVSGVVGLVTSFILSIEAWQLAADPNAVFACDVNSVISCGAVARTPQAQLLGFPNAFLGILFETAVLAVSIAIIGGVRFPRWYMRLVEGLYTIGLLFALWLFTQSYFVINALCPWCLLITVTTILVWAGLARINVRDGVLPAPAWARRFVASGNDWFITAGVILVIAAMIVFKYGASLFA